MPRLTARKTHLPSIGGRVPAFDAMPPGCRFAARCPFVEPDCRTTAPILVEVAPGHHTRCRRAPLSQVAA